MLKLEGERLELAYARDSSNGWCYRHALGKLSHLQDALLEENFGEAKQAGSIYDLEMAKEGEHEGEEEEANQVPKRPRFG